MIVAGLFFCTRVYIGLFFARGYIYGFWELIYNWRTRGEIGFFRVKKVGENWIGAKWGLKSFRIKKGENKAAWAGRK